MKKLINRNYINLENNIYELINIGKIKENFLENYLGKYQENIKSYMIFNNNNKTYNYN